MRARLAAAVVLMFGAGTAAGAELGRLFFTPAQRATLDTMRERNTVTEAAGGKEQAAPMPQNVSLDGVVRRSDGRNTVWLNSRAVTAPKAGGLEVATGKNDNRVRLSVPESGRRFDLKVGQTAELVSGTVAEGYARRAPLPKPDAKAPPVAEKTAAGVAPGAPAAASPPAVAESAARNTPARARARDAEDDTPTRRGSEPR